MSTSETLRQQIEETKSQLAEKLQSLEHQFTETVHTFRAAVDATATAVHDTVETVTGAAQDAARSVRNAFDLRRQIDRHPWWVLGGSFALGCLAVETLAVARKTSAAPPENVPPPCPSAGDMDCRNGAPAVEREAAVATAPASGTAPESDANTSFRQQLGSVALDAVTLIVQDIALLAVPKVMNYLTGTRANARIDRSGDTE